MRAEDHERVGALLRERSALVRFSERVHSVQNSPTDALEEEMQGPRLSFGDHAVTIPLGHAVGVLEALISTIDSALRRLNVEPPSDYPTEGPADDHQD